MSESETQVGDVTWSWKWEDQQTYALFLYGLAFLYAVWKQIQRSRLEYDVALQVKKLDQPIPRTLLWCCRLISFCFLLRMGWLIARISKVISDPEAEESCVSGWKCRGEVFQRALNRLASFMHIIAFSLIILYWVRWKNAVHREKVGRSQVTSSEDERQEKKKLNMWDIGFILIDIWLFLFQAGILAVSLVFSLGETGKNINRGYQWALSIAYLFLAFSMLWNGIEILNLVRSQHTYIKDILMQKRMAKAKARQMTKEQKQQQRKEKRKKKVGKNDGASQTGDSKEAEPSTTQEMVRVNGQQVTKDFMKDENTDSKTELSTYRKARPHVELPISAEHTVNSTKAVDDQVSKGIYKIVGICGICIPLFLMLVVLYMWRPATGRTLAEADVVYPWLMFVVPEIVSSLVVLYLISPTSKGFFRRLKKCECWGEIGDWIKWTVKDCIFCCTCCGGFGFLERKIYATNTGIKNREGTGSFEVADVEALRRDVGARGIPKRFYELSPDALDKIYEFDEDVNVNLDPLSRYPTYDAQQMPDGEYIPPFTNGISNLEAAWPVTRETPLLQEDLDRMQNSSRHPVQSRSANGPAAATATEQSTIMDAESSLS